MIEPCAQRVHFGCRCRHHIGTTIEPAGQQRTILLQENAVVYQRVRQQKIGETTRILSMFISLHESLSPPLGRVWHTLTEQPALRRIGSPISYVPHVDVPE